MKGNLMNMKGPHKELTNKNIFQKKKKKNSLRRLDTFKDKREDILVTIRVKFLHFTRGTINLELTSKLQVGNASLEMLRWRT